MSDRELLKMAAKAELEVGTLEDGADGRAKRMATLAREALNA